MFSMEGQGLHVSTDGSSHSSRGVRGVIAASWHRVARTGLNHDGAPAVTPLADTEITRRRVQSPLNDVLPGIRRWLTPVREQTGQALIIADNDGHVLWREGERGVMTFADDLGFTEGSFWVEENVGTNAIGTALVLGEPVHIHGSEHFVDSHREWTCAAAPIIDPVTHRPLGVVDLSGPTHTLHPSTLTLVALTARAATEELRAAHEGELSRLRSLASPILARLDGPALAVCPNGFVAAAVGCTPPARVVLPENMDSSLVHVPNFGHAQADPLPGGWLLRRSRTDSREHMSALLDLSTTPVRLHIRTDSGTWTHELSPRHAQIVHELARAPEGRTASELAGALFLDPTRTVTIRAEISRLRRILGPLIRSQPYRFSTAVAITPSA